MGYQKTTDIQEIEKIQNLLQKHFDSSNEESVLLTFQELTDETLLKNKVNVKRIFDIIKNFSGENISFEIETERHHLPDLAGQADVYPKLSNPYPIGIKVYISDSTKLKDYFELVFSKLNKTEDKPVFSFSIIAGILTIEDQDNKKYEIMIQGQVQKEVLSVMFKNPKKIYEEWSLYDISEILGNQDVDEIAVKNAIYQLDRKIKLAIPNIKKIFDLNKHSARLSPTFKK